MFQLATKNAEILALMQQFHTQKLNDYKAVLSTYAQVQMLYHSRALEFYTRGYQVGFIELQVLFNCKM